MAKPKKKTTKDSHSPDTPSHDAARGAGQPSVDPKAPDRQTVPATGVAVADSRDSLSEGKMTTDGEPAGSEPADAYEPLTPELLADETQRGDFVIAVVTVLLAFLLALFKIGDVPFWGHLAMGRHIVANGPPATDPFSYVVGDEPSVDPNWLTEAAIYAAYSSLGPSMLVLLKALGGIALALLLMGIRRPGPTLWSAACGAAVVLAMTGQDFIVGPEFVTLLGLATYLALLHRIRHKGQTNLMWLFVPLQALWVNLDERAFVGLLLIALWLIGELAARSFSATRADRLSNKAAGRLGAVFVFMLLASLASPYGLRALTYPVYYYGSMQPALADYWSETGPVPPALIGVPERFSQLTQVGTLEAFFLEMRPLELFNFILLFAAGASFVLNAARFDAIRLVVLAGFICLAGFSLETLGLLTVVAVTVTVLNGQEWYLNRFGTEPRLEIGWLIWSRAGRAVTVLSLAALAVFGAAGWLRGTNGYDFGMGIHPLMEESLDAIQKQLSELPPEARGFNMTLDQATVVMWLAPPDRENAVYMNDGMALYAAASGSAWRDYLQIRNQLLTPDYWKPQFDKHGISFVMLSMTPPANLAEYVSLLVSPDWEPVSLGGSLALYVRADWKDQPIAEFRDNNRLDFTHAAFRETQSMPPAPELTVESPNWLYDPLWKTRQVVPEGIARAEHLWKLPFVLANQVGRIPLAQAVSFNLLAIRNLRQALSSRYVDNPNGYLLLAGAYEELLQMESTLTMSRLEQELTQAELQRLSPIRQPHNVRFYQLLTALNQAVTADPKSTQARGKLAYWYYQAELWDMALEHYEALLLLLEDEEEIAKANEAIVRLTDRVERVRAGLEERRLDQELSDEDHSPFELSRIAGEAGCPKMALELAESQSYGFFDPTVQLVLAKVYTEIGQPESALRMLTPVTASGSQPDAAFDELLGTVLLLQGDYSKASSRWQASIEAQRREAVNAYLVSLRRVLVQGEPLPFFEQAEKAAQQPLRTASGLLHLGMLLMEAGQVEQAAERFREVLEVEPEAPFRILAAFYLNRLTNDDVDSYRPSDYIPMVFAESTESP